MTKNLLKVNDLTVTHQNNKILEHFNFEVNAGEVHAIMGPNGAGKSTFANCLARNPEYSIKSGTIELLGENINEASPDEVSLKGLFLGFQNPVEVPGLSNIQFLKTIVNHHRQHKGQEPLDAFDFMQEIKSKLKSLGMSEQLLTRSLNDGFSGGEKKRNEIFQLMLLQPQIAILDETDSGLDIDALKAVSDGINAMRNTETGIVLITHYQRLLDHIKPDYVHVLNGNIVKSGGFELVAELEESGYQWLERAS